MSRNGAGVYSVPNVFSSGATITASSHNENWSDVGAEVTNSVAADGQTSMTGPLKLSNGSVSLPSLTFATDTNTGLYHKAADTIGIAVNGADAGSFGEEYINLPVGTTAARPTAAQGQIRFNSELKAIEHYDGYGWGLVVPSPITPQGYLTPTSGTPIITSDVTAATAIYYTPHVGNLAPVPNGTTFNIRQFSELTLTLDATGHVANGIYDIFLFDDSGTLRIGTGPKWSTVTAGSCARGTGAGTTELVRLAGINTNKVAVTARNNSTTYSVAASCGLYLGSVYIDGADGQVSCHRSYGQSRKWGVWNAFNRVPLILKAGDITASWSENSPTFHPQNSSTANSLSVFCGLAEELIHNKIVNNILTANSATAQVAIGWNSTSSASGLVGSLTVPATGYALMTPGEFIQTPSLGLNTVTALGRLTSGASSLQFSGAEANMLLTSAYRA